MGHYQRWLSTRRPRPKEPTIYRCPHCSFNGGLDRVWWHIGQHSKSTRWRRLPTSPKSPPSSDATLDP
jgi:hypothetical protein